MDNVEVARTCVVCGKTFTEIKHPRGNKRKFCSHECEVAHRREYRQRYFRKRYEEDPEYREKLKKENAERSTKIRKKNKDKVLNEIVAKLAQMTDEQEIKKVLEEKFRIKSELYDKHARTLQVSEESRS